MTERKRVRCAIYTRKSSEEGLDQEFNSLQAQREACAGCCQTKANRSLLTAARLRSGGKLPPFGQRGLPVLLEPVAGIEVSVEIEVVVDGRVDGGEFLKTSHLPEAEHRPLSSSQW